MQKKWSLLSGPQGIALVASKWDDLAQDDAFAEAFLWRRIDGKVHSRYWENRAEDATYVTDAAMAWLRNEVYRADPTRWGLRPQAQGSDMGALGTALAPFKEEAPDLLNSLVSKALVSGVADAAIQALVELKGLQSDEHQDRATS